MHRCTVNEHITGPGHAMHKHTVHRHTSDAVNLEMCMDGVHKNISYIIALFYTIESGLVTFCFENLFIIYPHA